MVRWLEDDFPLGKAYFQGLCLLSGGKNTYYVTSCFCGKRLRSSFSNYDVCFSNDFLCVSKCYVRFGDYFRRFSNDFLCVLNNYLCFSNY